MNKKQLAGERAVEYIEDGMVVGLGTGSTVYWSLMKLGELVKDGLRIQGIPTSEDTARIARELQIPLTNFKEHLVLDLVIDGADAITPELHLIKGGGGALLREKLVAAAAKRMIVVADDTKTFTNFEGLLIPIEVVPFAWETTASRIQAMGGNWTLRRKEQDVFVTDNHNFILDAKFDQIASVTDLHNDLKQMVGVVETGMFLDFADVAIVAGDDGVRVME